MHLLANFLHLFRRWHNFVVEVDELAVKRILSRIIGKFAQLCFRSTQLQVFLDPGNMLGVILQGFLALTVIFFDFLHAIVKSSLRLAKFILLHKVHADLFIDTHQLLVDLVFRCEVIIHTLCRVADHGF